MGEMIFGAWCLLVKDKTPFFVCLKERLYWNVSKYLSGYDLQQISYILCFAL
jgi:hypothetical protein